MHDPLCTCLSQSECNSDETYNTRKNEVLCQNDLQSFARLLPKYVPLESLRNAPGQFWSMSDVVLELLGTVQVSWWTGPNGSLTITMTCNLYSMQWQRIFRWCNPLGNIAHIWTQRSTSTNARAQMQAKAQAWEQGVHVAGGALNLLKTIFFAVSWNYQRNGLTIMRTTNKDPNIAINMTQGNARTRMTPITHVEVTTGHRTLEVQLAPTANDKLSISIGYKRLSNCDPISFEHHWIGKVPELASIWWSYKKSATHWVLRDSLRRNATVSKLSICQRFSPKWESTDQHQLKYTLDRHSTQACP
jgi:hypothetical protein